MFPTSDHHDSQSMLRTLGADDDVLVALWAAHWRLRLRGVWPDG